MLKKVYDGLTIAVEFPKVIDRLEAAERRITELERKLREPLCPRCKLPYFHVTSTQPDPIMGDVGAMRRTYHCESCGLEESRTEV